jgi:hypothetical protein
MRPTSVVVFLIATLAACEADRVSPTPVVSTSTSASVDKTEATDVAKHHYKSGGYLYVGCFAEARDVQGGPLRAPMVFFDPPFCITIPLEVYEDGSWFFHFERSGYTRADYPGFTFILFDILGIRSPDGKCSFSGDTPAEPRPPSCVSEPRYVKKLTFLSSVEGNGYRANVRWTYSHEKQ